MILAELAASSARRAAALNAEAVRRAALNAPRPDRFPFERALSRPGLSVIAELKKASPSRGVIREDFPYLEIARAYERGGAAAISVLTEPDRFLGSNRILQEVRGAVSLPLLRKDFTVEEIQLYEARAIGADAVLLIAALLDTPALKRFLATADALGLSALVEAHDERELASALEAGSRIVGVNNRNLKDFTVDAANCLRLRRLVPEGVLFVAESGVKTGADMLRLAGAGADAALVGEALMRAPDPEAALAALCGGGRGAAHDKD